LPRLHLIEIHEAKWCPASLRDALTDTLRFYADMAHPFAPIEGRLAEALTRCSEYRVVDLCSGAGGPWSSLASSLRARLGRSVDVTLTDLHPNECCVASETSLYASPEPVDARSVPPQLAGFRTLFSSFHHFKPAEAREILRDCADRGVGIGVFEAQSRSVWSLAFFLTYLPLTFAAVPLVRPFRFSRLLWTYLIPALPIVITTDALASCLRTYAVDELIDLAGEAFGDRMAVDIGRVKIPWLPLWITYLVAVPRDRA